MIAWPSDLTCTLTRAEPDTWSVEVKMDAGTRSKITEGIELLSSLLKPPSDDNEAAGSSNDGSRDSFTGRAIQAVRSVRSRMAAEEQRRNFSPYPRGSSCTGKKRSAPASSTAVKPKRKRATWSPRFFCLSDIDQETVPSTVAGKEELFQCGLGEKKVEVEEELSPQEFKELVTNVFPKLRDSGGYELLRCKINSRQLEPISFNMASSPKLLRAKIIGNSRIYIRPIQCNLDTTPDDVKDDTIQAQKASSLT